MVKSFLKCHSMHLLLHKLFLHSINYHSTFEYLFHENAISKRSSNHFAKPTYNLQVHIFLKDLLLFYISLSNKIHTIDNIFLCDIKLKKHQKHPRFCNHFCVKRWSQHFFSLFFDRSLDMFPISPFSVGIQIFSNLLSYGNSCVNPILYAFLSEPFRRGFCAVVSCIRPSGPHGLHGWVEYF